MSQCRCVLAGVVVSAGETKSSIAHHGGDAKDGAVRDSVVVTPAAAATPSWQLGIALSSSDSQQPSEGTVSFERGDVLEVDAMRRPRDPLWSWIRAPGGADAQAEAEAEAEAQAQAGWAPAHRLLLLPTTACVARVRSAWARALGELACAFHVIRLLF